MEIKQMCVDSIKPAAYNPRRIDDQQFEQLKNSIRALGMIVPVLVNGSNSTIIAGHQRTKAAKALGIAKIPVLLINGVDIGDEIKFNQIHNGVDYNPDAVTKVNVSDMPEGFCTFGNERLGDVEGNASYVKEACKLMLKYGNVLSCVICQNTIIGGINYVKACQALNYEVNAYILPDSLMQDAILYLRKDYGVYSYDNIERNTYVQGLAQLYRSTEKTDGKKQYASMLYEHFVNPYLHHNTVKSILDFGCGKGAYINQLMKRYNAVGVEFYNNNRRAIDVRKGNMQIDGLIRHLKQNGKFDVVVCDSVLNSVDSTEAERSVMNCLNLFCNGTLFISGRPLDIIQSKLRFKTDISSRSQFIKFFDENHFTGTYRAGNWYFQHFHEPEEAELLLEQAGFKIRQMEWGKYGESFQIEAEKTRDLSSEEYRAAVDFEFNLPLPGGRRYGRQDEVKQAAGI